MNIKNIQGHRGARGLMPENTIPAFIKALDLGVTTLELDLAVTKDGQLVVSHEPYFNSAISLDSLGNEIPESEEKNHNIYQMSYAQISKYDVGSKPVGRFPNQRKMKVHKPLLIDLVKAVNSYCEDEGVPEVHYNMEIKSTPDGDNLFHPAPAEFSKLVHDFIVHHMIKELVNVQSFDFRVLQYFHENYPDIKLAVLVENEDSIDENLENLGFIPQIYSCYYQLLDQKKVAYLHDKGMKVIPWTINEVDDIREAIKWQVDGIISDYPNRVIEIISN